MVGFCESGNEPAVTIKFGKFLEQLRTLLHGVSCLVS